MEGISTSTRTGINTTTTTRSGTSIKSDQKLGKYEYWCPYKPSQPSGCYARSIDSVIKHGKDPSNITKERIIRLLREKADDPVNFYYWGNNPKEQYEYAIKCIDDHLDAGYPIVVGVNHHVNRKPRRINEKPVGVTDHFILVHSRVYINGYYTYLYYETGTSQSHLGFSDNNKLIYDPNAKLPNGSTGPRFWGNARNHQTYDVSQVRPYVGEWKVVPQNFSDQGEGVGFNFGSGSSVDPTAAGAAGGVAFSMGSPNLDTFIGMDMTAAYGAFASYDTVGADVIFGKVFPEDDNNRYIDMPSEEISVIQYTEPTLRVDELKIPERDKISMGLDPDKVSYYAPVVFINNFMIPQTYITNFSLDYTSFSPQVMVEFVDMTNELLSTNIPKPGTYIKVFIGGYGDEKYYKPIRQDFVITSVNKTNKTGGEYQNYPNSGNPIKYRLTGVLNVPLGFRKMSWSSSKLNARQAMFNISNTVGLGFATNFTTNSDVDVMKWVNIQNKSYFEFMRDISKHSCYSPYTFFTSFVDQYNVLNYVECRRLLSHNGSKTDLPQMIYNCIMPDKKRDNTNNTTQNKSNNTSNTSNTNTAKKDKKPEKSDNLDTEEQKLSYYFLTNSADFKGWTNYIEEYFEINDGHSMVSDGYSKVVTYSDTCGFPDLMSKNYRFIIMPIDNMLRDESKNIVSLPDEITKDSYIPLNLVQTTNSAYIESEYIWDNPAAAETRVNFGNVDTSNVHPLYFYASVQNDFQMKCLKKCGLSIRLQNYNPSITRFSRIWVDIYDMNKKSLAQIRKKPDVDQMTDSVLKKYWKEKNDNILSFEEEVVKDTEQQAYNRSLSGWYVVTDMKISYNTVKDFKGVTYKKLQTQLILNRIDYKPTFKSEYELAKKAIEKYKGENLVENILCGGDSVAQNSSYNLTGEVTETSTETSTTTSTSTTKKTTETPKDKYIYSENFKTNKETGELTMLTPEESKKIYEEKTNAKINEITQKLNESRFGIKF